MSNDTGDEIADHLIKSLSLFKRLPSSHMKLEATRWELIIRTHAMPAAEPLAVDFAAPAQPEAPAAPTPAAPTPSTTSR